MSSICEVGLSADKKSLIKQPINKSDGKRVLTGCSSTEKSYRKAKEDVDECLGKDSGLVMTIPPIEYDPYEKNAESGAGSE